MKELIDVRLIQAGEEYHFYYKGEFVCKGTIRSIHVTKYIEFSRNTSTFGEGDGYVELPERYGECRTYVSISIKELPLSIHNEPGLEIKKEVEVPQEEVIARLEEEVRKLKELNKRLMEELMEEFYNAKI